MRDAVLRRLGLGLLVTVVLALLALNLMAWTGGLVDEGSAPRQESVPTPSELATVEPRAVDPRLSEQIARRRRGRRPAGARPGNAVTLVLTARRGDCWVEVKSGSSTGETLYAGTLANGRSLRFNRPSIWLRIGAASNVDIEINGRQSAIPPGTVELVLPDA